jgi:hypothetical protein
MNNISGTIYYPSGSSEVLYRWDDCTLFSVNKQTNELMPLYQYDPLTKMMKSNDTLAEPFHWDGNFLSTIDNTECQPSPSKEYWFDKNRIYKDREKKSVVCDYDGTLPYYIFDLLPQ